MFLADLIKYLLLGIIQGFTEPIPVSSSGHLLIFKQLLDSNVFNDLNFEIIVNFGSLIAIIFIFKDDILNLIKDFFGYIKTKEKKYYKNFKYCWLLVIGTIPAGIIGLLFKDIIAKYLDNIKIIGLALLITALFLFIIRKFDGKKKDKDITFKDALIIGLFQAVAVLPGISRSGATIVGGMFQNFSRETAFKFSFLLYIPISLATMVLGVSDLVTSNTNMETWIYYFVGLIASAIVTYFATKWFRKIMEKGNLIYFVIYCAIVGSLVLIFL